VRLDFVPAKRQRVHNTTFDLSTLSPVGVTARGTRIAAKPVARIVRVRKSARAKETGKGGARPRGRSTVTKKRNTEKPEKPEKPERAEQRSLFEE